MIWVRQEREGRTGSGFRGLAGFCWAINLEGGDHLLFFPSQSHGLLGCALVHSGSLSRRGEEPGEFQVAARRALPGVPLSCCLWSPRLLGLACSESNANGGIPPVALLGHFHANIAVCRVGLGKGPPRLPPITKDLLAHRTHPAVPMDLLGLHIPAATRRGALWDTWGSRGGPAPGRLGMVR